MNQTFTINVFNRLKRILVMIEFKIVGYPQSRVI